MIKAIIFDCFGVILTDSLQALINERLKGDQAKYREAEDLIGMVIRGLILPDESNQRMAEILDLDKDEYVKIKTDGEVRNQDLLTYVSELRKNYKTAMLSNVSTGGLLRRFNADELDEYFDVVVASGEVGFAKPEAQAYEITADRLDVRLDECVFIDDRQDYCDGATGVGMTAILYSDFDQLKVDLQRILEDSLK